MTEGAGRHHLWKPVAVGAGCLAVLVVVVLAVLASRHDTPSSAGPTSCLTPGSGSTLPGGAPVSAGTGPTSSAASSGAVPPPPPVTGVHFAAGRTPLCGFAETAVVVHTHGKVLTWCLLLAQSLAQQERGLMAVTDPTLGGYDGMLFRFGRDETQGFYMRDTPLPLSIAYLRADGHVVQRLDMAPCGDVDNCPTYPPSGLYRSAIEVPKGSLARLGIDDTAVVTVGGSCPAAGTKH